MKYIWNIYIRNLAYNYILILGFVFWSFCASNRLSWEGRWCKGIRGQNICNNLVYGEETLMQKLPCYYISYKIQSLFLLILYSLTKRKHLKICQNAYFTKKVFFVHVKFKFLCFHFTLFFTEIEDWR